MEGYADLISVFQAGIQNIVASSGTALTEEQIRLLGRYTKNTTLVYDADSAGSKAMIRGVDLIIENGLEVKVVELPPTRTLIPLSGNREGDAFQVLLDRAVTFLEFKANLYRAEGMFESPDKKTKAIRSIVQTIAKMKDELKRNLYIQTLAEKYGIYESVLFRELEQSGAAGARPYGLRRRPERKPVPAVPSRFRKPRRLPSRSPARARSPEGYARERRGHRTIRGSRMSGPIFLLIRWRAV